MIECNHTPNCKTKHLWKLNLEPDWTTKVHFLRRSIKVPVTCRTCGQKGLETWLYSHTEKSEK